MIDSKNKCSMCGKNIKEEHPTRIMLQNFHTRTYYSAYKNEQQYYLCSKCVIALKQILKKGKADK